MRASVTQSCPTPCNPWTVAHQAPLSLVFSRQEYWSGLPCPSQGDLSDLGLEPGSPALRADSLPSWGYSNTKWNKNIFKSLKMRIIWQMFLSIDPPQIVVWRQFLKFSVDLLKENWIDVQSVFTQNKTGIAFSKDYTNYSNLSSHASLPREYLTFLLDHVLCSLLWDRN